MRLSVIPSRLDPDTAKSPRAAYTMLTGGAVLEKSGEETYSRDAPNPARNDGTEVKERPTLWVCVADRDETETISARITIRKVDLKRKYLDKVSSFFDKTA